MTTRGDRKHAQANVKVKLFPDTAVIDNDPVHIGHRNGSRFSEVGNLAFHIPF